MTTQDINNTNDPQRKYRLGTVSKNILLEGLNQFHGANLALNSDVDQDTFRKVTKHNKHDSQEVNPNLYSWFVGRYNTVIDFNEVNMRIYLPEKIIFTEAERSQGRGEYHL